MAGAATDLFDLAQELLDAAAEGVALSPAGPIGYKAVSPGPPAYDCVPSLFVHAGGPVFGDTYPLQPSLQPMHRIGVQGLVDLVQLTITVLRCIPVTEQDGQTISLPQPAAITNAARETYGDLWAIWNHLITKYRAGDLFPSPSSNREFIFDPALPVRQQGGAGGWEISIRVQLGGYRTS